MNMSSVPYEPTWYRDTGTTNYMICDDASSINRQAYNRHDQVTVAHGATLTTTKTGNMTLSTPNSVFKLKEILHVSNISVDLPNNCY